jgi:hypothetical protein
VTSNGVRHDGMCDQNSPATTGAANVIGHHNDGCPTGPATGQTDCPPTTNGGTCSTPFVSSGDGSSAAQISSPGPTSGTESIDISFNTEQAPCSDPGTGDTLIFSTINAGGYKSVEFDVFGGAADKAFADHPNGQLCLGSPTPFTTASGTQAQLGPDGLYYGLLPICNTVPQPGARYQRALSASSPTPPLNVPCLESASYTPAAQSPSGVSELTTDFVVSASDPRATH